MSPAWSTAFRRHEVSSLSRASPAQRQQRRADVSALLFLGAFAGFQFVVTLYLQELRGWSPLLAGLAMLVIGLDAQPALDLQLADKPSRPRHDDLAPTATWRGPSSTGWHVRRR